MSPKDAYHHGNLRRALLDEALRVIAQKGVQGLSLREIAARVGVSHTALYHHFSDKSGLIHALAHEGQAKMDERMAAAALAADDASLARLLAIGEAYVLFAVEQPEYYAAFVSPEMGSMKDDSPQPPEAGADVWGRLLTAVVACQQSGGLPAGDPVIVGVGLWALVHGLAELWRVGPLSRLPQAAEDPRPLIRLVLEMAIASRSSKSSEV